MTFREKISSFLKKKSTVKLYQFKNISLRYFLKKVMKSVEKNIVSYIVVEEYTIVIHFLGEKSTIIFKIVEHNPYTVSQSIEQKPFIVPIV